MERPFRIAAMWLALAVVIASAVVPTLIANLAFLPRLLLAEISSADEELPRLPAGYSIMGHSPPIQAGLRHPPSGNGQDRLSA
jgi:hypothetical protein